MDRDGMPGRGDGMARMRPGMDREAGHGSSSCTRRRPARVIRRKVRRVSDAVDHRLPPALGQVGFRARFDWGPDGVQCLAGRDELVIVVDVLSFSTAVSVAVERGARIAPYRFRDETAAAYARSIGARLAGSRADGEPSLSPVSLRALGPGDLLVLPSPNGATCAAMAAEHGAVVVAGSLRNATTVGRFGVESGRPVAVIAAGERWPDGRLRPAFEDLVGGGAILAAFEPDDLSPEARAAVGAFQAVRTDLDAALLACASGRELVERGFALDVEVAAELDATGLVPVLEHGVFGAAPARSSHR